MADGVGHNLYYRPEQTSEYGSLHDVDPTDFERFRQISCSIGLAKSTYVSEEARSDRNVANLRHGTKQVNGDVGIELSYGAFDDILEAVLGGTWAANVLKNGIVRRSFSLVRDFSDIGAGNDRYHPFYGIEFEALNLTFPTEGIVTGTFGVLGQTEVDPTDIIPGTNGALNAAPANEEPYATFNGVIKEDGVVAGVVTELSLTLINNLAVRHVIGGGGETLRPSIGQCVVTGSMSAYLTNAELIRKYYDEESTSIEMTVQHNNKSQTYLFPKLKFTGGQPDSSSSGPIIVPLPFQSTYDTTQAGSIVITRNPAIV